MPRTAHIPLNVCIKPIVKEKFHEMFGLRDPAGITAMVAVYLLKEIVNGMMGANNDPEKFSPAPVFQVSYPVFPVARQL